MSVSILSWFCPLCTGNGSAAEVSNVKALVEELWLIEEVFRVLFGDERKVWLAAVSYTRRGDSGAEASGVE
jgi:hypothetical protein